jgi:hypothetical protein
VLLQASRTAGATGRWRPKPLDDQGRPAGQQALANFDLAAFTSSFGARWRTA